MQHAASRSSWRVELMAISAPAGKEERRLCSADLQPLPGFRKIWVAAMGPASCGVRGATGVEWGVGSAERIDAGKGRWGIPTSALRGADGFRWVDGSSRNLDAPINESSTAASATPTRCAIFPSHDSASTSIWCCASCPRVWGSRAPGKARAEKGLEGRKHRVNRLGNQE